MNSKIFDYLDELIPNPTCELNYKKDYELLIATMLSAQTTDKRVNSVTEVLFKKYPTIKDLKDAPINDVKNIIRSIGTYNKKAINVIDIANHLYLEQNGIVPNDRNYLENLPGVGRKTTNVVLSNLYNEPCIAVDTHVKRVSARLGISKFTDNVLEVEKKLNKVIPKEKLSRIHHQFVLFGRYYCKAKNPNCNNCKIKEFCKKND
ncbi:MAG: endonuclease III [Clostridium sp.]|nr:endonuclease III [Clostridium sp.]MCM1444163.1 endonuclease III [Candidatus Amulumruptor caecigallinarius]